MGSIDTAAETRVTHRVARWQRRWRELGLGVPAEPQANSRGSVVTRLRTTAP
jgi:hypothetical protein